MNNVFSNAAASLIAFTAMTQSAYAHHEQSVEDKSAIQNLESFCYISLPPELNRPELEGLYGNQYDAPRDVAWPQRSYYFSAKGILDIEREDGRLSVTLNREGIIGQEFTVHRHTRADDTVSIPQGLAKPKAQVEIDINTRSVLLDLSDKISDRIAFDDARFEKQDRQIAQEGLYTGIFDQFGVAAFSTPSGGYLSVNIGDANSTENQSQFNQEDFSLSIIGIEGKDATAYFYQSLDITGPQAYSDDIWIQPPLELSAQLVCTSQIDPN